MWQKERLLNIGIKEVLTQGYKKIAWLDADIVFDHKEEWPWYISECLERSSLCQVFSHAEVATNSQGSRKMAWSSLKYLQASGVYFNQSAKLPRPKYPIGTPLGLTGLGWAARAELLQAVPLYDRAILGGADKMIYGASFPELISNKKLKELTKSHYKCPSCGQRNESPKYTQDYQKWAKQWANAVGGSTSYVYQGVKDLYHGNRKLRNYMTRREILYTHDFDPMVDIAIDENGCWKWNSDKPELHHDVAHYFLSRKEDV